MKLILSSFLFLCYSTLALAQTTDEKSFLDYFDRYSLPISNIHSLGWNKWLPDYYMERNIWGYEPYKSDNLDPDEIINIVTCYSTSVRPLGYYIYKGTTFIIFSYDEDSMLLGVLNKDSILTESLNLGDCWGIEDINIQGDSISVEYGSWIIEVRDTPYYKTNPIKRFIYDFDEKKFKLSDTSSINRLYIPEK